MIRHGVVPHLRAAYLGVLAFALAPFLAAPAQAARACPVDPKPCCAFEPGSVATHAPIRMGVNIWTHDLPAAIGDIVSIHPKALRFAIGPWWKTEEHLPLNANYDAARAYVDRAFAKREAYYRSEIASIRDLRQRTGAELHLVIWEPPLTEAEDLAEYNKTKTRKLDRSAAQATARFYAAFLASLSQRGLDVDIVELSNEPDGNWNISIDPDLYLDLVAATRKEAQEHDVRLPAIAGPGVAVLTSLARYLGPPARSARMFSLVDHISAHAWDDRAKHDIVAEAGKARALLDQRGWRGRMMVTEVSVTFPTEDDRARDLGPTRKGDDIVTNRPDYAAALAATSLGLAAQGFDTLISWQFRDPSWDPFSYGLESSDGQRRPGFGAWRDVSARINADRFLAVKRAKEAGAFGLFKQGAANGIVLLNRGAAPAGYAIKAGKPPSAAFGCRAADGGVAYDVPPGAVTIAQ
jgi:hypothetical protein